MKLEVKNDNMYFINNGYEVLIPGYQPKVQEKGELGKIINEENSLIVERILTNVSKSQSIVDSLKEAFSETKCSDLTCIVMLMAFLCDFYTTPEYPASKIKNHAWEHIAVLRWQKANLK